MDLEYELALPEMAPDLSDLDYLDSQKKLEAKVEKDCRSMFAKEDSTQRKVDAVDTYKMWKEEALNCGMRPEFFEMALEEVVTKPLEDIIEKQTVKEKDYNTYCYYSHDTIWNAGRAGNWAGVLSGLASVGYGTYMLAGVAGMGGIAGAGIIGLLVAVPVVLAEKQIMSTLSTKALELYTDIRKSIKSAKSDQHRIESNETRKLLSYLKLSKLSDSEESFVKKSAEKGLEIDYHAVIERATEIQQEEYAKLEARYEVAIGVPQKEYEKLKATLEEKYEAARGICDSVEHLRLAVLPDFVREGHSVKELERRYSHKHGSPLSKDGDTYVGEVKGIVEQMRSEFKEEEERRIEEETLAELC